eukprot:GFUD01040809.1.p1 GENE.GFUD01040809.1~~GFUD01040809.1.p1  ORF type:complete len:514 (-),score=178.20 GFUD01040809.1:62-1603(-)
MLTTQQSLMPLRILCSPIITSKLSQPSSNYNVNSPKPIPRQQKQSSHVSSPWPSIAPPKPVSLASFIFENLQDHATLPALVSGDSSLTYLETWSTSLRFGSSLLDQGVKPGQVLAAVLPNKTELPIVTLGATEVGIAVAPICPSSPTESICRQLVSSCATAVITTSDLLSKVNKAARYYGKLVSVIVVDDGNDRDEFKLGNEQVSYKAMISRDVVTWPTQEKLSQLHFSPAVLAWCSGASHSAFSHKNVIVGLEQMGQLWDSMSGHVVQDTNEQITTLVTVPANRPSSMAAIMFHLRLGHRVVLDRKCPTLPAALDLYKPSVYHLGPIAAQWIADSSTMAKHLTSLRHLAVHPTVAPLNSALIQNLSRNCGPRTLLTQHHSRPHLFTASHVRFQNPAAALDMQGMSVPVQLAKTVASSCGLPLADTECKVVGPDGVTVSTHTVGKLCLRGPQVMEGIWDRGVVDREAMLETEGWLVTEDSAYCDDDGNLFLVDVHPYNGKISFRTCKFGTVSH